MIYLLVSIITGIVSDHFLNLHIKSKHYPCTVLLSVITCAILIQAFDDPILIVKGLIFSQALILIGYYDAKTHEIPDQLLIPVMASGFLYFHPIQSIIGLFSVSLLFFIISACTHGTGIGGGDVKFIAAAGFVLEPVVVYLGTLIGLLLFLIVYIIYFRKKKFYAMAPWLGTGCFLAYILAF